MGSNRTFMELKCESQEYRDKVAVSSNRTFMELKCAECDSRRSNYKRSNRTFMELKWRYTGKTARNRSF